MEKEEFYYMYENNNYCPFTYIARYSLKQNILFHKNEFTVFLVHTEDKNILDSAKEFIYDWCKKYHDRRNAFVARVIDVFEIKEASKRMLDYCIWEEHQDVRYVWKDIEMKGADMNHLIYDYITVQSREKYNPEDFFVVSVKTENCLKSMEKEKIEAEYKITYNITNLLRG